MVDRSSTFDWGRAQWFLAFLAVAITSVPVAVLFHELGHWLAAQLTGFSASRIHYAFTEIAPRSKDMTHLHLVVLPIAGPVFSILLALMSILGHRASGSVLFAPLGIFSLSHVLNDLLRPAILQTERARFAVAAGIPVAVPYGLDLLFLFGVALYFVRVLRTRHVTIPLMLAGWSAGFLLWMKAVGPAVLP